MNLELTPRTIEEFIADRLRRDGDDAQTALAVFDEAEAIENAAVCMFL